MPTGSAKPVSVVANPDEDRAIARKARLVAVVIAVSIVLFILAGTELGNDVAALGFVSIAAGYAVTGVFSSNQRVQKWTHLTSESNDDLVVSSSVLGRIISPFRINQEVCLKY